MPKAVPKILPTQIDCDRIGIAAIYAVDLLIAGDGGTAAGGPVAMIRPLALAALVSGAAAASR